MTELTETRFENAVLSLRLDDIIFDVSIIDLDEDSVTFKSNKNFGYMVDECLLELLTIPFNPQLVITDRKCRIGGIYFYTATLEFTSEEDFCLFKRCLKNI